MLPTISQQVGNNIRNGGGGCGDCGSGGGGEGGDDDDEEDVTLLATPLTPSAQCLLSPPHTPKTGQASLQQSVWWTDRGLCPLYVKSL